jgi:hypothetical protein
LTTPKLRVLDKLTSILRGGAQSPATAFGRPVSSYQKLDILMEAGFVVLRDYDGPRVPEEEWVNLEYMDWKSGGDTNFAPIASATGDMECKGFWEFGKPERNGIWTKNAENCPTLVAWTKNVGANFGRVRIVKLNPQTESEAIQNLHRDTTNNRMTPNGEGWIVRAWLQLTDDPASYMILRDVKGRSVKEWRVSMPRNRQIVVDSERLLHAVVHPGPRPRYAMIVSFESSLTLKQWIESQLPQTAN